MASLLTRLFHRGRYPAALAAVAAGPDVLLAREGQSVHVRARDLRVPGRALVRAVSLHAGAVVLTQRRIMVSIGRSVVLDAEYAAAANGALTFQVDSEGVHLHLDVAAGLPGGTGTVTVDVLSPLEPVAMAGLPLGEQHIALSSVETTTLARTA